MRNFLADVNVWLASVVAEHPHHEEALAWWRGQVLPAGGRVVFCRLTQLGLLRLLTNERVLGPARRTIREAWTVYEQAASQRAVAFAQEPEGLEPRLAVLCGRDGSSPKFWTDAYLAAFAQAEGLTLATFDRGFARFPDLEVAVLGGESDR